LVTVADCGCGYDDLISDGRLCESDAAGEVEELAWMEVGSCNRDARFSGIA